MELGCLLSPEYLPGTDMHAAIREQQTIVSSCRELGFSTVLCAEHLSRGQSVWLPPIPLLSRVCEHGAGMTFGTAVLAAALHNPVALAEQVGFLDAATEGRFVLGLASGWNRSEFESVGAQMSTRGRALDETIEILRLLWGSDEPVSYDGQIYNFHDVMLSLRPAAGAAAPLWLGASTDRALSRAARVADNWIISSHMSTEQAGHLVDSWESMLAANGRSVPAVRPGLRSIFVGKTAAAARHDGGEALTSSYAMYNQWGLFKDVFDERIEQVDYTKMTERGIIGDPESVAEQLVAFIRATKVNLLLVRSQWIGMRASAIVDSLELLKTVVMPMVEAELDTDLDVPANGADRARK